jgi:hypothetical protein
VVPKVSNFALTVHNRLVNRSSPFLLPHHPQIDADVDNVSINRW